MFRTLREHGKTIAVAAITAMAVSTTPTIAGVVADFARDSHRVDGKHAVGAGATVNERKGKLVATNRTTGKLPNNILDLSAYQRECRAGSVLAYARIDVTAATSTLSADGVDAGFNCTGGGTLVMKAGTGRYYVRFPGLMDSDTEEYVVTSSVEGAFRTISVLNTTHDPGTGEVPVLDLDIYRVDVDPVTLDDVHFSVSLLRVIG